MKNKETQLIQYDLKKLKELAEFKRTDAKEWRQIISQVTRKIGALFYYEESPEKVKVMSLFDQLEGDFNTGIITIQISKNWEYILNNMDSNFTQYDMGEFFSIKSSYLKTIYRNLKQFRKKVFG